MISFYSLFHQSNPWALHAFSQPWMKNLLYVIPSFYRLLKKTDNKASVIPMAPFWVRRTIKGDIQDTRFTASTGTTHSRYIEGSDAGINILLQSRKTVITKIYLPTFRKWYCLLLNPDLLLPLLIKQILWIFCKFSAFLDQKLEEPEVYQSIFQKSTSVQFFYSIFFTPWVLKLVVSLFF